jgi:hypothetical protein
MEYLPLPSSLAGWPFAILAGISLPMHARQLFNPQQAMKQYEVNSVVARLLGIISSFRPHFFLMPYGLHDTVQLSSSLRSTHAI